ncbi:unnamed protein product, partial [Amoebophrya sp. A25]
CRQLGHAWSHIFPASSEFLFYCRPGDAQKGKVKRINLMRAAIAYEKSHDKPSRSLTITDQAL